MEDAKDGEGPACLTFFCVFGSPRNLFSWGPIWSQWRQQLQVASFRGGVELQLRGWQMEVLMFSGDIDSPQGLWGF